MMEKEQQQLREDCQGLTEKLRDLTTQKRYIPIQVIKEQAEHIPKQLVKEYWRKWRPGKMTFDEKRRLSHPLNDVKGSNGKHHENYVNKRGLCNEAEIDYLRIGFIEGLRIMKGDINSINPDWLEEVISKPTPIKKVKVPVKI